MLASSQGTWNIPLAGPSAFPRHLGSHLAPPLLLVLLSVPLFFVGLGSRDLHSSHEARAAQNAQMILEDGAWGLPRLFNQRVELQKPPLYYWLVALAARACGGRVDAWTVRLPAALSALGCILVVYLFGARLGRPRLGFLSAVVLATCLHFTWLARVGRVDMALTLAVTVSITSFYLGTRFHGWWFVLAYTGTALGILAKGPVAVALVAAALVPWLLLEHRRDGAAFRRAARSLAWGIPVVLGLAVPWFVWANSQTGGALWDVFFVHHNLERGLGGSETLHAYPFWYYLPRLAVDLFPWSMALPIALWLAWRFELWSLAGQARLAACWFLGILVLLSCLSFKRADYLLPAFPGVALFLGAIADAAIARNSRTEARNRWVRWALHPWSWAALVILCVAGWLVYALAVVPAFEQGHPYARMARDLRRLTHRPVIFFRTEAHTLVFHVGRPMDTILEWENLEVWANRKWPVYFVMPPDCATTWHEHVRCGRLEHVFSTADYFDRAPERPLVVLRSCPD